MHLSQDIRKDLQCVILETMREARPEENGIVFRSVCVDQSSDINAPASSVSMMSKDVPGSDDIKTLVAGLKQLDAAFQQQASMVARLAADQQSAAQHVCEAEDSVQQLKYLVLHSIQLPAKPAPAPR